MSRHAARIKVSGQLLIDVLGMPEETLIFNIRRDDFLPDVFELIVEHPELPEIAEGGHVPEIEPIVRTLEEKQEVWKTEWDWNLPDGEPAD